MLKMIVKQYNFVIIKIYVSLRIFKIILNTIFI